MTARQNFRALWPSDCSPHRRERRQRAAWRTGKHGFHHLEGLHHFWIDLHTSPAVCGGTDGADQLPPDSRALPLTNQATNLLPYLRSYGGEIGTREGL